MTQTTSFMPLGIIIVVLLAVIWIVNSCKASGIKLELKLSFLKLCSFMIKLDTNRKK